MLTDEASEVVHFGIEENGQIVYLSKDHGNAAVETVSKIGKQIPMHSILLWEMILAELLVSHCKVIID